MKKRKGKYFPSLNLFIVQKLSQTDFLVPQLHLASNICSKRSLSHTHIYLLPEG